MQRHLLEALKEQEMWAEYDAERRARMTAVLSWELGGNVAIHDAGWDVAVVAVVVVCDAEEALSDVAVVGAKVLVRRGEDR
jgi:hypothetical protein